MGMSGLGQPPPFSAHNNAPKETAKMLEKKLNFLDSLADLLLRGSTGSPPLEPSRAMSRGCCNSERPATGGIEWAPKFLSGGWGVQETRASDYMLELSEPPEENLGYSMTGPVADS